MTSCTKYDRLGVEKRKRHMGYWQGGCAFRAAVMAELGQIVGEKVRESGPAQIELALGSAAADPVEERGW